MNRKARAFSPRLQRSKWLVFAVFVTLLMFGLIGWQAVSAFRVSQSLHDAFVRGERFSDRVVTLHQEQMLSLAMLVATGSSRWEQEYEELERDLYATIQLAIQEDPPGFDLETLGRLQAAHERLRDRAIRAIELARVERSREGLGMLSSPKFQRERKKFLEEIRAFVDDYRELLGTSLLEERQRAFTTLGLGVLIFVLCMGVWVVLLRYLNRNRSELEQEITERKNAEEGLRQIAGHLQSAGEQERGAIARELHDEMGQSLTAIKIDLVRLRKRLPDAEQEAQDLLNNTLQLVNETITSVQRILSELRPSILDHLGLVAAIEWQANEFQERTGIECVLSLDSKAPDLSREQTMALFRIFQESLTNVSRHSGATQVRIDLSERDNRHQLTVADNGSGISEQDLKSSNAYGLMGMRERAHVFGGQLEFRGEAGTGTTICLRFPAPASPADDRASRPSPNKPRNDS